MPTFSRSAVSHTNGGSSFRQVSYRTTVVPAMIAANAVHMPAACISGETANHGGTAASRTLSWISWAESWSAPIHRRHVHVGLSPQHTLGPTRGTTGADHRAGHRATPSRRGRYPLAPARHPATPPRAVPRLRCRRRPTAAGRRYQAGTRRRISRPATVVDDCPGSHVVEQLGDLTRRVVVVDVDRNGAGLQAADHHVGVQVVVHDQRHTVLPAFPVLQAGAFPVGAKPVGGEEVRQPPGAVG